MKNNGKMPKLIKYMGGDYRIADKIFKMMQKLKGETTTFVEVFGGSGYISQTEAKKLFKVIIYNDLDEYITSFYEILKERPNELHEILKILPHSKEVHNIIQQEFLTNKQMDALIKAIVIFYLTNTSYSGVIKTSYGRSKKCNEGLTLSKKIDSVLIASESWKNIQIDCLDFEECIKRYDSKHTFFYCDPPFLGNGRDFYRIKNFDDKEADRLINCLNGIKGTYLLKITDDQLDAYSKLNYRYINKFSYTVSAFGNKVYVESKDDFFIRRPKKIMFFFRTKTLKVKIRI